MKLIKTEYQTANEKLCVFEHLRKLFSNGTKVFITEEDTISLSIGQMKLKRANKKLPFPKLLVLSV